MRAPVLALLSLLLAAAPAAASTARVDTQSNPGKGCTADPSTCQQSELVYVAGPGEANDVQVSFAGSSLLVRDPGVSIEPGLGCQAQGQNMVRCSPPEGPGMGFVHMDFDLGGMDDRLQNAANLASSALGGEGDDHLIGGSLPDTLDGGAGRDRLEGADGPDQFLDETGDASEADVVNGGAGHDLVSYASRTSGVTVDLRSPANPSGAEGEADSLANVESANGGRGPDVMRAGNAPVTFAGGGGNDRLIGSFGADVLLGDGGNDKLYGFGGHDRLMGGIGNDGLDAGCGPAKLYGEAGNDRLYSANGARDRLRGGTGRDFARFDQLDDARQAERRQRLHIDGCAL